MLFHEIYGSYYQTVSLILQEAVRGTLTKKSLSGLIKKHAFGESSLNIPSGLTGEQWRLLHQDLTTPLTDEPKMPLTILETRWLKALLLAPRIRQALMRLPRCSHRICLFITIDIQMGTIIRTRRMPETSEISSRRSERRRIFCSNMNLETDPGIR